VSLAQPSRIWHGQREVKTITLEDIYADPHVLDPLLAGEPVEVMQKGERLGQLTPRLEQPVQKKPRVRFDAAKHRAWFLKTHGPDAYKSTRTTADIFDELRRERSPRGE
jgi:hypothetical protein